jgi:hypothetical protein
MSLRSKNPDAPPEHPILPITTIPWTLIVLIGLVVVLVIALYSSR